MFRRLNDYARFLTWNFGLGYIALWAMTFWTLDHGHEFFGRFGECRPDPATVLFYWICDPSSPLSIVATLANTALTLTVWGPVYLAAATIKADAIPVALPIVFVHLTGFSTAILITVRVALAVFQALRHVAGPAPAAPDATPPRPFGPGKARDVFGLRGAPPSRTGQAEPGRPRGAYSPFASRSCESTRSM